MFTSPVTTGAIAASHATASAASPSSQAPPSLPVSDANARRAAHRARTCAVHCSCSAGRSASPSPSAAAATSSSSDSSRNFSGSRSVHKQISRPTDAETSPAASAASTRGWVAARLAQAVCPTAAPRVIPVWWISQARAL